jgi:hypothetical protein
MDRDIDTYMEMNMNTDMDMDMDADMDMDIGFFHKCFLSHNFVCRDIVITKYRLIIMLRNYT